ncbi:DUF1351 domain-containing protein [Lachnobacterium bovis]|uniref:DUF1351 domain-containing protein n=1 Tax=Lachnobacterium bovis TaxID=140626 RepID=UPI0009DD01BE|nr:DUF1351 domain-containing protein [Lachnobacterium bovis]
MMELNVKEVALPKKIEWNYEELKAEIAEKAKTYETMVYTDDQIKLAKSDKAKLNHLKKALNDERIAREREYMKPFNEFQSQINEIISIIDKPVSIIDKQVKEYDQIKKREKAKKCLELFEELNCNYDWLDYSKVSNPKWTNTTFTLKKVQEEIEGKLEQIENDLNTLSSLEAFSFEAIEEYKRSLDVGKAIAEGQRLVAIQKRKEEMERRKAEQERIQKENERKAQELAQQLAKQEQQRILEEQSQKSEEGNLPGQMEITDYPNAIPEGYQVETVKGEEAEPAAAWIRFEAKLTTEQAYKLKDFFEGNKIEFRAI